MGTIGLRQIGHVAFRIGTMRINTNFEEKKTLEIISKKGRKNGIVINNPQGARKFSDFLRS